jgi:pectate lyase
VKFFTRKVIVGILLLLTVVIASFIFVVIEPIQAASGKPNFDLIGFANMQGKTTGGTGGSTVTVTSLSAFKSAVAGSDKKIVQVRGLLKGNGKEMINIGSNKTVIGVGNSSGFRGAGLQIQGRKNVIIRNLKLSFVIAPGDLIVVDKSDHVWIDHNEFFNDLSHDKGYYDGLLDIINQADYITVSWNRFHDHFKGSLVGNADEKTGDRGKLHVTYHHNWFNKVMSRLPSLRFGTGHIYNNYFQDVDTSGINSRMGAQVLVENNVFHKVYRPLSTDMYSVKDGYAVHRGNDFGGAAISVTQIGTFTQAPYTYWIDPTTSVKNIVTKWSGIGMI